MKTKEAKFTRELQIFSIEITEAIQFFYAYLTINAVLSDNRKALDIVNQTPLFWNTNVSALQASFFVTLGRILDQNSKHNIDRLLSMAQKESVIFSVEALEGRKRAGKQNADEWIQDYIKDVYVPTATDFRRLRKYINKYRKIYESVYREIRHKVYAHKELSKPEDLEALFARTNIREIQKLLIFLNRFHEALWQLFYNGLKPTFRPMKYSVTRMRKEVIPKWVNTDIQEHMVYETERFFKILAAVPAEQMGHE